MPFCPRHPAKFEALLSPLMNGQEEWELGEFWRHLDELLVAFAERTATFSPALAGSTDISERRAFLRPLRLLVENEERDAIDLFAAEGCLVGHIFIPRGDDAGFVCERNKFFNGLPDDHRLNTRFEAVALKAAAPS